VCGEHGLLRHCWGSLQLLLPLQGGAHLLLKSLDLLELSPHGKLSLLQLCGRMSGGRPLISRSPLARRPHRVAVLGRGGVRLDLPVWGSKGGLG
jgi:hypothetical protein